jgi:hypothetical protein
VGWVLGEKPKMIQKKHKIGGACDRRMVQKIRANSIIFTCSKRHMNGPNALFCWVCGEFLQAAQKTEKSIPIQDPVFDEATREINKALGMP